MIRPNGSAVSDAARQAREELIAAREHLLAAADHSAKQLSETSRRRGAVARKRANAAATALRGEQPSPWTWLAAGLAAGAMLGAAGAVALRHLPDREQARERANSAVDTVRHRAGETAQAAVSTARDKAQVVRERFGHQLDDTGAAGPTGPDDQPAREEPVR